jgi:hypothetical protein
MEVGVVLDGGSRASDLATREQIEKRHRKPRAKSVQHTTHELREAAALASEVEAIIPLLPECCRLKMLGGEQGMAQVPEHRHLAKLRRRLTARAGTSGARLARTRLLLGKIRIYAALELRVAPEEADEACFPMSAAMADEIIHLEHARATTASSGSQGGASVGNGVRDDIVVAAEVLGWPIEVDKIAWATAAPKGAPGQKTKAGTPPLALKCQLEIFAGGGVPRCLAAGAREACIFYARSLLCGALDQGVRVGEGARIVMVPDPEEPEDIMAGVAYVGKGGTPIEVAAVAEGFLGVYDWWPEHAKAMAALGQTFPEWVRPWGSKGSILKAGTLTAFAAKPASVCAALKDLATLPPLSYTASELQAMNLQGHSCHLAEAEWSRCIGENPSLRGVDGQLIAFPEPLSRGFNDADADTLGNWLSDAGAKAEATAAHAAAAAPGAEARRAAAVAALPGRRSQQGTMRVYYGAGGAGGTRFGQKFKLISARQRLTRFVRAPLQDRDWQSLPRGQADLSLLRSRLDGDAGLL